MWCWGPHAFLLQESMLPLSHTLTSYLHLYSSYLHVEEIISITDSIWFFSLSVSSIILTTDGADGAFYPDEIQRPPGRVPSWEDNVVCSQPARNLSRPDGLEDPEDSRVNGVFIVWACLLLCFWLSGVLGGVCVCGKTKFAFAWDCLLHFFEKSVFENPTSIFFFFFFWAT